MPNVSIGSHFEEFVEAQVKNGRFHNASEVVRAGLRLLEDQELERAERAARLAKSINESFDEPGDDIPADDVFDRLERQYAEDMKARRRGT
ncbi:MAG: type II toxin-antitoxin system ParD family antitoxin [Methylocystis silviterrae]|uniref:type II toxin-antitoxin system ParD family antitoxin n=1 Tax=Methylocystis silviterrae TaxID=2743612 RepID=UPI003C710073